MEISKKNYDGYEEYFSAEEELFENVKDMEKNSEWIPGIPSNALSLESIFPIDVCETAANCRFNEDLAMETASSTGSQLFLSSDATGRNFLVRNCAKGTLAETAKLSGSALGRMGPEVYADTLNNGFSVARGSSMLLIRYGKLSSCHSDGDGGYAVMPISEPLADSKKVIKEKFGDARFESGYNSHSYTEAFWTLPTAQNRLVKSYQDALDDIGCDSQYPINFMPGLRFWSSDTANACAVLQPVFQMDGSRNIAFCDGVRVKHTKKSSSSYGTELFKQEIADIYAKFDASIEAIKSLAKVNIYHPENVVISLCKKFNIPKKYGEAAREEIVQFASNCISAHDVYLAMTCVPAEARDREASKWVINNLEEAVAKIVHISDWKEFDVGGTVVWSN